MSELLDELSLKIKQLNDRARKATVERPTTPSSISLDGKTNSYHSQLKLKLPNFNGDPLEWRTFWNLFDSLISQEKGMTDEQKACHLTDTMADSKAKEIAKISTRTGCYQQALQDLKELYDQPRVVFPLHLKKKLCYSKTITYDREDFRQLKQTMQQHYTGMEEHDACTIGHVIGHIMVKSLDEKARHQWSLYSTGNKEPPHYE